jgi:hypothetical protein
MLNIRERKGCAERIPEMATWIDCARSDARALAFLIDALGEEHIVFGSDPCGGLGPLKEAFNGASGLVHPERFKRFADKNSRALIHIESFNVQGFGFNVLRTVQSSGFRVQR